MTDGPILKSLIKWLSDYKLEYWLLNLCVIYYDLMGIRPNSFFGLFLSGAILPVNTLTFLPWEKSI